MNVGLRRALVAGPVMVVSVAAMGLAGTGIAGANPGQTVEPVRTINGCDIVANPTPDEHTICPGGDLSYHDLRGANLRHANLAGANLHGSNISGADFTGAYLRKADLSNVVANNTNFTDANGTLVVIYRTSFDVDGVLVGDFNITTGDGQPIPTVVPENMQTPAAPPPPADPPPMPAPMPHR